MLNNCASIKKVFTKKWCHNKIQITNRTTFHTIQQQIIHIYFLSSPPPPGFEPHTASQNRANQSDPAKPKKTIAASPAERANTAKLANSASAMKTEKSPRDMSQWAEEDFALNCTYIVPDQVSDPGFTLPRAMTSVPRNLTLQHSSANEVSGKRDLFFLQMSVIVVCF